MWWFVFQILKLIVILFINFKFYFLYFLLSFTFKWWYFFYVFYRVMPTAVYFKKFEKKPKNLKIKKSDKILKSCPLNLISKSNPTRKVNSVLYFLILINNDQIWKLFLLDKIFPFLKFFVLSFFIYCIFFFKILKKYI